MCVRERDEREREREMRVKECVTNVSDVASMRSESQSLELQPAGHPGSLMTS